MIGKVLGAVVGDKVAKHYGENGVLGAALGAGAAAFVRRLGPLGLALAGGVVAVRYYRNHRKTTVAA